MPSRPRDERPATYDTEIAALGARVRKIRLIRGWTLEVAAERTGVDWKHLQKIEAAQLNPTIMTIARIAEGYQVPLWVLFRGPT